VPKTKSKAKPRAGAKVPARKRQHAVKVVEKVREHFPAHAKVRMGRKLCAATLTTDGIVSVCCKSALAENVDRASREPERFYLPAYIGHRGWFGPR
jgi:hypothetical protein